VARLVAQARREATPAPQPAPRWLATLRDQMERTGRSLRRARDRVEGLGAADRQTLRAEMQHLQTLLHEVGSQIDQLEQIEQTEQREEATPEAPADNGEE
jgi:hypothetical protein